MKKILTATLVTIMCHVAFAQGFYFEMKMSSSSQGELGTMKVYGQDGNSRADIAMNIPGMGAKNINTLVLKSVPGTVYMLDEKAKTYSELSTGDDWKDAAQDEYEVTVIGKEKVNGYNSTHVKVKKKGKSDEQELWTSIEIADYASLSKLKTQYTGKENLAKALEAKGAGGFPVRIKTVEHGNTIQVDIVKAEKRTNPASMFTLTGYNKSEGAGSPINSKDLQEMVKKMQNMTPEEREKMIEQLKKQYEQQPH
jgi:hypothetical protein